MAQVAARHGEPGVQAGHQIGSARHHLGRGHGRGPAAHVCHLVHQRSVTLVADGRHDRNPGRGHGPAELLVAPGQHLGGIAPAPGQDDDVDGGIGQQLAQGGLDARGGSRAAHRALEDAQREAGEALGRHGLDVVADGGIGSAHDPDETRQPGQGAAVPFEEPVDGQGLPGGLDDRGHGPLADRDHLLGQELHRAPVGLPVQPPGDQHPLTLHDPAAPQGAGRHPHRHRRNPVLQGEVGGAAVGLRLVDLAGDGDATDGRQQAGNFARKPGERDLAHRFGQGQHGDRS